MLTDLAITPISKTIDVLAAEQRSGDLLVGSGAAAWMVHFHDGQVVFAASNLKQERLGESLVAAGRITADQFDRASALMAKPGSDLRFGDALVQAGLMRKDAVERLVAEWVAKIVLSLFRLEAGTASFEDRVCTIPQKYRVSLSTQRLLLAGINTMANSRLILAGIGDLDRSVKLASAPSLAFSVQKASPEERELLQRGRVPTTLRELVSTPKGPSLSRVRAAYAFLASGILQEVAVIATSVGTGPAAPPAVGPSASQQGHAPGSSPQAPTEAQVAGPSPQRTTQSSPVSPPPQRQAKSPASPTPVADNSPEIERLLSQVNVSLMVSDLTGAVRACMQLVNLAPKVALYRARLADLMARLPQTMRDAEQQYIEALRLDPDSAELHFKFGLYYRSLRVPSRALAEFREVLRLDPHHREALEQLETAAPQDPLLASIKKLLRRG